jgi:hypothetical protein
MNRNHPILFQKEQLAGHRWLMVIILATQKAESRKSWFAKSFIKKAWGSGSRCRPYLGSNPSTAK